MLKILKACLLGVVLVAVSGCDTCGVEAKICEIKCDNAICEAKCAIEEKTCDVKNKLEG